MAQAEGRASTLEQAIELRAGGGRSLIAHAAVVHGANDVSLVVPGKNLD